MEEKIQSDNRPQSDPLLRKPAGRPAPGSSQIDGLYGAEYFRGPASSYGSDGYLPSTVDWPGWLEIIQQFQPSGRLCDLGCAFGYLVELAGRAGYQAVGVDISSFALRQLPGALSLVQANLQQLPFPDACFDVVAVFDVLEHIEDGNLALAEAVRILKPEGLLIGTTPDPVFFKRKERTHCFERPPSFWVDRLQANGFDVAFRFSGFDYNFQFLARRPRQTSSLTPLEFFHHDYFGPQPEFVIGKGITTVLRTGWGLWSEGSRTMEAEDARIYLLNSGPDPMQLRIRGLLRNPNRDFGSVRISLKGFRILEIEFDSEHPEQEIDIAPVPLARGGHNLLFEMRPPGGRIHFSNFEIEASPMELGEFLEFLPFDLFQRYALAGRISGELEAESLLDVGGLLGDSSGHLATSSDFLNRAGRVVSTDIRPADLPEHIQTDALALPFSTDQFDVVLSLDVLEHLPESRREAFLDQLNRIARKWVLLGFPVRTPEVEEAEHHLASSVLKGHGFLAEHASYGLPHKDLIEGFARRCGLSLVSFPSGYLPHWLLMQGLTQAFSQFGTAGELWGLSRLYNRRFLESDWQTPCYRRLFLLGKQPLTDNQRQRLSDLLTPPGRTPDLARNLLADPEFLQLEKRAMTASEQRREALAAVQFLVGEREKEILLLRQEVDHLKREMDEIPLWRLWRDRLSRKWNS